MALRLATPQGLPILPRRSSTADRSDGVVKDAYGVEPMCKAFPVAPSTYYERVRRRPRASG